MPVHDNRNGSADPGAGTPAAGGAQPQILSFDDWVRQNYGRSASELSDDLPSAQQAYQDYVAQQKASVQQTVEVPTDKEDPQSQLPEGTYDYRGRDDNGYTFTPKPDPIATASTEQDDYIKSALEALQGRQAPAGGPAAQTGPTAQAAAGKVADVAAPVAGTASAVLPDRSAVGSRQMNLADLLTGIAGGGTASPASAEVEREMNAQEAAQLSAAASAPPALRAIALQNAQANIGALRSGAAREIATRDEAYRNDARNALVNLLSGARTQDIAENSNAANAANAANLANAQLATSANIAGASNASQLAGERGQLEQGANLANAASANAADAQNAQLRQQQQQFLASLGLEDTAQRDQALNQLLASRLGLLNTEQTGALTREQIAAQELMQKLGLQSAEDIARLQAETQLKIGEMNEPSFLDRAFGVLTSFIPVLGQIYGKKP